MQRPVEERAEDFERAPPAHPTTTIKATAPQAATSSDSPDSPGQGNAMLWCYGALLALTRCRVNANEILI